MEFSGSLFVLHFDWFIVLHFDWFIQAAFSCASRTSCLSSLSRAFPSSLIAMVLGVILFLQVTHCSWDLALGFSAADGSRSDGWSRQLSGTSWLENLLSHHCRGNNCCGSLVWAESQAGVYCFPLDLITSFFFLSYQRKILFFTAKPWVRKLQCLLQILQIFWLLNGIFAGRFLSQILDTVWIINI